MRASGELLRRVAIAVCILCAATPAILAAQIPIGVGVLAGRSSPSGAFGNDFAKSGWHIGGSVDWSPPALPVSFRAEAVYDRFGETGRKLIVVGGDAVIQESFTSEMYSATGNLVWGPKRAAGPEPYVIAGAGIYPMRTSNSFHDPSYWHSKKGVNAGARVSRFRWDDLARV